MHDMDTNTNGTDDGAQTLLIQDDYSVGEDDVSASQFARRWLNYDRSEQSQYHGHFNGLCRIVGHDTPAKRPDSDDFTFQRAAPLNRGTKGFADVFLRDRFIMEYKAPGANLDDAYIQALGYRDSLGNPPLILVSDFKNLRVHTNFTGTVSDTYYIELDELFRLSGLARHRTALGDDRIGPLTVRQVLNACFYSPEDLKPTNTPEALTEEAARRFNEVAMKLADRNPGRDVDIARFLSQMLFIMFASEMRLLPKHIATQMTEDIRKEPTEWFTERMALLVTKMTHGAPYDLPEIPRFNGGLFDGSTVKLAGIEDAMPALQDADRLNWSQIEPSIFGTMFERIFNPQKRSQFGRHYTSRADIEQLAEPVLMAPLRREWQALTARHENLKDDENGDRVGDEEAAALAAELQAFVDQIGEVTVLDPACGSGNFLYVALSLLYGLEREVFEWALDRDVPPPEPRVHPRQLHGIELDEYAHSLASVVIWIGHIQNSTHAGHNLRALDPILEPLHNIECRDAVVTGGEVPLVPEWPQADCIIGNPPFLGNTNMRRELGEETVDRLYEVWRDSVPRRSDFCIYWFEKARQQIESGRAKRAGLLGTQGIRGVASRKVLERILDTGGIFFAVSDQAWRQGGASVRISMVGFDDGSESLKEADGRVVSRVNADLTSRATDLGTAKTLKENLGIAFKGLERPLEFEVSDAQAQEWMIGDTAYARSAREVMKPLIRGAAINGRMDKRWLIDFGPDMDEDEATACVPPYEYLRYEFDPEGEDFSWWEDRPKGRGLRKALAGLDRYIVTSRHSKHRIFVWAPGGSLPESSTVAFATEDDFMFGVLQSSVHDLWARAVGSQLREQDSGARYTHSTCFEQFPFPYRESSPTADIEAAVQRILAAREVWLAGAEAKKPHERVEFTLTNLYNEPTRRLRDAHADLDRAVFRAYGWREEPADLADEEALSRLLELNIERAKSQ